MTQPKVTIRLFRHCGAVCSCPSCSRVTMLAEVDFGGRWPELDVGPRLIAHKRGHLEAWLLGNVDGELPHDWARVAEPIRAEAQDLFARAVSRARDHMLAMTAAALMVALHEHSTISVPLDFLAGDG